MALTFKDDEKFALAVVDTQSHTLKRTCNNPSNRKEKVSIATRFIATEADQIKSK